MKPEGAIELAVTADLAECSYEDAREQVVMELQESGSRIDTYYTNVKCCLFVSLWNIDVAIQIMAKYRNCDICAKMDYGRDEWSILAKTVDTEAVIWSPGV